MLGYRSVANYVDLAYQPVETAMTNQDDLVHLLVALGALINISPKNITSASSHVTDRLTLKDYIENTINTLNHRIDSHTEAKTTSAALTTLLEGSGWQKFYREYQEYLKTPVGEEERRQALQKAEKEERERLETLKTLEDTKTYFLEVKQLLHDHGAKTLKELYPDADSQAAVPPLDAPVPYPSKLDTHSYMFLSYRFRGSVPQHLLSSYDELYEACYLGDNQKIQSLCLPADSAKSESNLLNISIRMIHAMLIVLTALVVSDFLEVP